VTIVPAAPEKDAHPIEGEFKFSAFISYSHQDESWARWLQSALETYRVPAKLVGQRNSRGLIVPRRLAPVCRDRSDLSSSADLTENIKEALRHSESLIVICSPRAAASRWVNQEISLFSQLGRTERIFCLIIEGEPNANDLAAQKGEDCFPQALRFRDGSTARRFDPLAADVRAGHDGKTNAKLKLIAALLGVEFDRLKQRDQRRRLRRMMWVTGGALVVTVLMTGLAIEAVIGQRAAEIERQAAERRQKQAENLVDFMLGDLNVKLRQVQRLEILEAVDNRASEYFLSLPTRDVTDQTLSQRVKALQQIGRVRADQGQLPAAIESYSAASTLASELLRRVPTDLERQAAYAETLNFLGNAYWYQGNLERAGESFQHAVVLLESVSMQHPTDEHLVALASARTNLGRVREANGDLAGANALYRAVLDTFLQFANKEGADVRSQARLADAYDSLGKVSLEQGKLSSAIEAYRDVQRIRAQLWSAHPSDRALQEDLVVSDAILGRTLELCGAEKAAEHYVSESVSNAQALVEYDATQADWREELGDYSRLLAEFSRRAGELGAASLQLSEGLRVLHELVVKDSTNATWRRELAAAQIEAGRLRIAQGDLAGADRELKEALTIVGGERSSNPADRNMRLLEAQGYLVQGQLAWRQGEQTLARADWMRSNEILASDGGGDPNLLAIRATALLLLGDRRASAVVDQLAATGYETPEFRLLLSAKKQPYTLAALESRCGAAGLRTAISRDIH
jgi:tetratricopeptide (TPR) repeat protein